MGYIKHNAIIVTDFSDDIYKVREKAVEIFKQVFSQDDDLDKPRMIVSEVVESVANMFYSFFIAPDGSKEGWELSQYGDEFRELFLDWLKSSDYYCDYVEIRYGGDDEVTTIVRDKDRDMF